MAASAQIAKVNHYHEAIADLMLAYPDMSKGDIANKMGYTQSWLSAIINSDAFIVYFDQRRAAHNQIFHQQVVSKLYKTAVKAIDKVDEALDAPDVDPRYALDAKDKLLEKLGFGAKNNQPTGALAVQNNYFVSKEFLQGARQLMSDVHGQKTILPGGNSEESVDITDATILPHTDSQERS